MTKEQYRVVRIRLGMSTAEFGKLLNYGQDKKQYYAYKRVHEKEFGARVISNSDTAICNLIKAILKIAPKTATRIVKLAVKNLESQK